MRIACWSGPRNVSTALMRSFGARSDCAVVDEPLYAAYLADTGKPHPGRDAVMASQPTDWRVVVNQLAGPIAGGRPHQYQKHMAHHLLPDRVGPWLDGLVHVLLIRDAAEVLSSLLAVFPDAELEDTGLPQQVALHDRLGGGLPVVDGRHLMDRPEPTLRALCDRIGLPFDPAMLSWEAGPRPEDGVWAEHWYAAVWRSTGFEPWQPREIRIPRGKLPVLREAERLVERLRARSDG